MPDAMEYGATQAEIDAVAELSHVIGVHGQHGILQGREVRIWRAHGFHGSCLSDDVVS